MRALRTFGALLLVASGSGCVARYKPPTVDQPHAVLKVRRSYQTSAGVYLHERVTVDEHEAFAATDARSAVAAPRTDALLAHPRPAELHVESGFFHLVTGLVTEPYFIQVPYSSIESYSCGTGNSYRTCSRSVTRYRSETHYRSVYRTVPVSDGACGRNLWIAPRAFGSYIVEYDYADDQVCHLACFEQLPGAEPGTFENRQCAQPSPEEIRKALEAR